MRFCCNLSLLWSAAFKQKQREDQIDELLNGKEALGWQEVTYIFLVVLLLTGQIASLYDQEYKYL